MTNPQNCQYFGEFNPYPLEINEYHRFLIPNHNNTVDASQGLSLWCGGQQVACEFGIDDGKLFRVSIIHDTLVCGNFEIRNDAGATLFVSNAVRFVNSELGDGRKFIRIATKHHYNRKLFNFSGGYDWIVTNLPAYDLGRFKVEADVQNARTGGNNTLRVKETYLDEVCTFEFQCGGDANILSFIQVHATNNEFYIDGTKRTLIEKIEADEFAMHGKASFASVKDASGLNITLDTKTIFKDVMRAVLSNESKTAIYIHSNNKAIPTRWQ